MAMTHARALEVADHAVEVADRIKAAFNEAKELLRTNSNLAIDWGAQDKPAYLNESVNGNLDGREYARADISNAVGSIEQFRKLMENEAPSQGDHLGNLNKIAEVDTKD